MAKCKVQVTEEAGQARATAVVCTSSNELEENRGDPIMEVKNAEEIQSWK